MVPAVSLGPAQVSRHILLKKELKWTPSPAAKPSPRPHSGPVMRLQESGNSLRGSAGAGGHWGQGDSGESTGITFNTYVPQSAPHRVQSTTEDLVCVGVQALTPNPECPTPTLGEAPA